MLNLTNLNPETYSFKLDINSKIDFQLLIFCIMIFFYVCHEAHQLLRLITKKSSLFSALLEYVISWENILDMLLITLSVSYLVTLAKTQQKWNTIYTPGFISKTKFLHFESMQDLERLLQSKTSAMLFLGFIKAVNLLKLNPKTYLIADTIRAGCGDIIVFMMFVLINYVFFGIWGHAMFAEADESQFGTLRQSIFTSVASVVRNIDFGQLLEEKFAWLVFWQSVLYFYAQRILINFVVAVIIHYFDKVFLLIFTNYTPVGLIFVFVLIGIKRI